MNWSEAIDKTTAGFFYGSGFVLAFIFWIGVIAKIAKYLGANV
jgi:hypothetical protein